MIWWITILPLVLTAEPKSRMDVSSTDFTVEPYKPSFTKLEYQQQLLPHLLNFIRLTNELNYQEQAVSTFWGMILSYMVSQDFHMSQGVLTMQQDVDPWGIYDISITNAAQALIIELKNRRETVKDVWQNQLCDYLIGYKAQKTFDYPMGMLTTAGWTVFYSCTTIDAVFKICDCVSTEENEIDFDLFTSQNWSTDDFKADELYDLLMPYIKAMWMKSQPEGKFDHSELLT